jgi:hypothetical protein
MASSYRETEHRYVYRTVVVTLEGLARELMSGFEDGFALQRLAWPRSETDREQLTIGICTILNAFV